MKTVKKIKVWDVLVRFTHWAVAIGILANLAITEEGSTWHEYTLNKPQNHHTLPCSETIHLSHRSSSLVLKT